MVARTRSRSLALTLSAACAVTATACSERSLLADHATGPAVGVSQYNPSSGSEPWGDQLPDVPSVAGTRMTFVRIRIALRPFGSWNEHPEYGPVWLPSESAAGAGFTPYLTAGHWVPTDGGMYWASDLPFGWVTFHYGRWVPYEGRWAWVPGARFAPAWVDWRTNEQYAGWAPLPPEGAPMSAPYSFCSYNSLTVVNVYNVAVVGAPAVALYGSSTAMPSRRGFGGARYAWGPTDRVVATPAPALPTGPTPVAPAGPPPGGPLVVSPRPPNGISLAAAWARETTPAPRAGIPVRMPPMVGATDPDAAGTRGETVPVDEPIREASRRLVRGTSDGPGSDGDEGEGEGEGGSGSRNVDPAMPARARSFRDYEPVVARPRISETVRISDPSEPVYTGTPSYASSNYAADRSPPLSPPPAPPSSAPSWGRSAGPWNTVRAPAPAWQAPVATQYAPPAYQPPVYQPPAFQGGQYAVPTVSRYTPPQPMVAPAAAVARSGPAAVSVGSFAAPAFAAPRFNTPNIVAPGPSLRRFQ